MRSVILPALFVVAAATLQPSPALAQDADVRLAAAARDFFSQGLRFADKAQWAEAADRFRRALTIRYSPVIAFNLASSLEELGELVEASELLYRVEADQTADATMRQSTSALLANIRARLSQLTVHAEGRGHDGRVLLDGLALPEVQVGAPFPVDPGVHELVLLRTDRVLAEKRIELAAGQHAEVTLAEMRVPTPAEVAAAELARGDDPLEVAAQPPITERWWLWAGMGTVLAGVVAVVTVAALSGDSQRAPQAAAP